MQGDTIFNTLLSRQSARAAGRGILATEQAAGLNTRCQPPPTAAEGRATAADIHADA